MRAAAFLLGLLASLGMATLLAPKAPGLRPARDPNCFYDRTNDGLGLVKFCLRDRLCDGECSGGVFRGLFRCKDAICLEKFGFMRNFNENVVVKFNQVGSEVDRFFDKDNPNAYLPASSTKDEIAGMQLMAKDTRTVKLLGLLGKEGEQREINGNLFWEPGLVMEFVKLPTLRTHMLENEDLWGSEYSQTVSHEMQCIVEQIFDYAKAMIHKGFFHQDMHWRNVLIRKAAKSGDCPGIKIIDFGIQLKIKSETDPNLLLAAVDLAERYDSVCVRLFTKTPRSPHGVPRMPLQMKFREALGPRPAARRLMAVLVGRAGSSSIDVKDAFHSCRRYAFRIHSFCSAIQRYINIKNIEGARTLRLTSKSLALGKTDLTLDKKDCTAYIDNIKFCVQKKIATNYYRGLMFCRNSKLKICPESTPIVLKLIEYTPALAVEREKPIKRLANGQSVLLPAVDLERELYLLHRIKSSDSAGKLVRPLRDIGDAGFLKPADGSKLSPSFILPGIAMEPFIEGDSLTNYLENEDFWRDIVGRNENLNKFLNCVGAAIFHSLSDLIENHEVDIHHVDMKTTRVLLPRQGQAANTCRIQLINFSHANHLSHYHDAYARLFRELDDMYEVFFAKANTRVSTWFPRPQVDDELARQLEQVRRTFANKITFVHLHSICKGYESVRGSFCRSLYV